MGTGNDTTTALNPGSGGDSMGESLVLQKDLASPTTGGSLVKHARVVLTDDDGRAVAAPLTERTGCLILDMLSRMNDKLATLTNSLP